MKRISSLDTFRALTMFFMIWVNDFWTLTGVPDWLLHAGMTEDRLGFADIIFPIFLVIVGMSIPFAIQNRLSKGASDFQILLHILERTLALVVMGFFLVNYENLSPDKLPFKKVWTATYLVICFFLIWNSYPASFKAAKILKLSGVLGLLIFAFLFPGGITALKPYWWGILGLIGWSYLWGALSYLMVKNHLKKLIAVTIFFLILSILNFMGILEPVKSYIWIVEKGALPFLVMLGVLSSVFYINNSFKSYPMGLVLMGLSLISLGFILRPYWGISKILATPAWICITGGLAYLVYALLYWIVDIKKSNAWSIWLKPAGVATLTCYLVPYFWYTGRELLQLYLPKFLLEYPLGLLSSALVSIIIIQITGVFIKYHIKLKV